MMSFVFFFFKSFFFFDPWSGPIQILSTPELLSSESSVDCKKGEHLENLDSFHGYMTVELTIRSFNGQELKIKCIAVGMFRHDWAWSSAFAPGNSFGRHGSMIVPKFCDECLNHSWTEKDLIFLFDERISHHCILLILTVWKHHCRVIYLVIQG